MSIISKMVLKYLRLNKKRTAIAVGSVILSVTLLMICANVFVWGFSYMQEIEKITYGDWHVRYHDLKKEQADDLTHRSEFASCKLEEMENGRQM